MVELYLKQINIFILPKDTSVWPSMRKPGAMFVSRTATVGDFKFRIATLFKKFLKQKINTEKISKYLRLWRLEEYENWQ